METGNKNNKVMIYLLVVFFALFVGTSIFLLVNNKSQTSSEKEIETTPTSVEEQEASAVSFEEEKQGSLDLTIDTETTSFPINKEITVGLKAGSMEKNIVGYDVVIVYDSSAFEFVKATSLLADFNIYTYKNDGYLSLLGTKIPQSKTPSVFNETKIVNLVFKPLKAGQFDLSLKTSFDKDKTDLITNETEVLVPALNELNIEVK